MLFTTALFAWVYLPVVLVGFYLIARWSSVGGAIWLFLASLVFYAAWMPEFTLLLVGSIAFNFTVGKRIGATKSRTWLTLGVGANLGVLAYFKYAGFFVANLNAVLGVELSLVNPVLPIGISFFTFTQIAFLVDAYFKGVREPRFFHYGLFVTYFPHLVAGPVLHHAQMMPQFSNPLTYRFNLTNFTVGLSIFGLGLIKKVVLADGIGAYADAIFIGASHGELLTVSEAWLGALAYTFQLYFDFSGYSDMAVGLSWMFNIKLPFNFNSPYRAVNISEFWRRWHMTLSAFLRDYLYIALGGNRRGVVRRYANLLTTMVLGGLWHGASWSFVLWGTLHGLFLVIHQIWASARSSSQQDDHRKTWVGTMLSWTLTMFAVVSAWVLFRATSLESAIAIYASMFAIEAGETALVTWNAGLHLSTGWLICAALTVASLWPRNSNDLGERLREIVDGRPTVKMAVLGCSVTLMVWLILLSNSRASSGAFIYFNF